MAMRIYHVPHSSSPNCARIHLRSISHGQAHPLAVHPMFTVELDFPISYSILSGIALGIVGSILLVKFDNPSCLCYEILVWDWQSGVLLHRINSNVMGRMG